MDYHDWLENTNQFGAGVSDSLTIHAVCIHNFKNNVIILNKRSRFLVRKFMSNFEYCIQESLKSAKEMVCFLPYLDTQENKRASMVRIKVQVFKS